MGQPHLHTSLVNFSDSKAIIRARALLLLQNTTFKLLFAKKIIFCLKMTHVRLAAIAQILDPNKISRPNSVYPTMTLIEYYQSDITRRRFWSAMT